eukprot:gene6203-1582_t
MVVLLILLLAYTLKKTVEKAQGQRKKEEGRASSVRREAGGRGLDSPLH